MIGINRDSFGYIFGFFAFMYMLMAFLVGPLTKCISSRMISFFSFIVIAIGCVLIGPISPINNALISSCSQFVIEKDFKDCLNPKKEIFIYIGLAVMGVGMGSVVTPILSELVVAIKEKLGNASKEANDKASSLFTMCSALGSILGQLSGAALFDEIGIN